MNNTARIARLKLLFIAAKVVKAGNRDKVKYSIHDARTPEMFSFLQHLDKRRSQKNPGLSLAFGPSDLLCQCKQEISCMDNKQHKIIMLNVTHMCMTSRDCPD